MEKIISMILLATTVFVFNDGVHGRASDRETQYVIDRKLKALNKPAVKTIMSEDGDTIDCVDIYKQPSLDHPALKNHTVQLRPSFDLTGKVDRINKSGQPVVNPELYGDNHTRLFAYWTADGYNNKGCFDLTCAGFINTNTNFTIGGTFHPISTTLGEQWQINIAINRDPQTGYWWFVYQNNVVGYWPASLFNSLKQSANLVEWGGEVYSQAVKKTPHARTAMGSGEMAYPLYGNARYIRNVKILDTSLQLKYPEWVGTWTDESSCYNAYNDLKDYEVPSFFFGGTPGRNADCQ
ncbi:uncharacterized protein LOC123194181 [Mangifera indica]|uniref:uncharacterized protein LOC123194181 n=1 Tax=Mangifera indica TaxID=29780 RepID=UPI001CFA34AF|nr:uncharacterized protein LOC123194181 [Mangifera indica]